jgi:8-oxo-dGTP diphosphatase
MGAKDQGADATAGRWLTIPRTLCFIRHGDDVLLMKRGTHKRIFPGFYNGLGGHLERNEDPLSGAIREMREETGLNVNNVTFRGVYNVDAGQETGIVLFIFTAEAASRDFTDCDEGTLHWIPIAQAVAPANDLPLVEDLRILLPRLFGKDAKNALFFAHVGYDSTDKMKITFAGEEENS